MVSATASITANVTRYCASETANVRRGGTKKKLKQAMFSTAVSAAGPRPRRSPEIAAPSRYTMTRFVALKNGYINSARPVQAAVIAAAQP